MKKQSVVFPVANEGLSITVLITDIDWVGLHMKHVLELLPH